MGTGYQREKNFGYRWVPGTGQKNFLGTDGYWATKNTFELLQKMFQIYSIEIVWSR